MDKGELNLTIGKVRKKRKITQDLLGWGICNSRQVSKIENGEEMPDYSREQ